MDFGVHHLELEHFVQARIYSNDLLLQDSSLQEELQISRDEVLEELHKLDSYEQKKKIGSYPDPNDNFWNVRFQTNMVLIRSEKLRDYFGISEERVIGEIKKHQSRVENMIQK